MECEQLRARQLRNGCAFFTIPFPFCQPETKTLRLLGMAEPQVTGAGSPNHCVTPPAKQKAIPDFMRE